MDSGSVSTVDTVMRECGSISSPHGDCGVAISLSLKER